MDMKSIDELFESTKPQSWAPPTSGVCDAIDEVLRRNAVLPKSRRVGGGRLAVWLKDTRACEVPVRTLEKYMAARRLELGL